VYFVAEHVLKNADESRKDESKDTPKPRLAAPRAAE
jgi:hypothetical protein